MEIKVEKILASGCSKCFCQSKGHACIYVTNSDEYMCDYVPLHL